MIDRNSPVTEDELHVYVDGELPADRREAVETWLAGHPEAALNEYRATYIRGGREPALLAGLADVQPDAALARRFNNEAVRTGVNRPSAYLTQARTRLADFNSAFKLVWGPTLRKLGLEAKGMNYSTEVTSRLLECGIVPVEVAIEHRPRVAGVSSMKLVRGALHRFLFVTYIALRQLLLKLGILMRPEP